MSLIFSALKTMEDAEDRPRNLFTSDPQPRNMGWWYLLGIMGVVAMVAGGVSLWLSSSHEKRMETSNPSISAQPVSPHLATTVPTSQQQAPSIPVAITEPTIAPKPQPRVEVATISTPRSTITLTKAPQLVAVSSRVVEPSVERPVPTKLAALPSTPARVAAAVTGPKPTKVIAPSPQQAMARAAIQVNRVPARAEAVSTVMASQRPAAHVEVKAMPDREALVEKPSPAKATVPAQQNATTAVIGNGDSQDVTEEDPAEVAAVNKEIVSRRNMSFHVAMLMTDFRAAVASGNTTEAKQKLEALEALATPDSLTLLRARAYWALTQGHMTQAMELYRSVLVRVPDDRDAMLNLAVAEWQVGQKSDALVRIETLAKRFPDDMTVQRYVRAMGGQ